MSYTLNTGHALHANLIDLIGVQGGALVSHKTARTFTPHASATYGSGTWGEHFKTGAKGWNSSGATFTPDLTYDTSGGKGFTIFYAVNNIATAADSLGALQQSTVSYGVSAAGQRAVAGNSSPDPYQPLTTVGVGAKSICVTRNGETSNKSYIDGILEYTGGRLGWNTPTDGFNSIGGFDGQGVAGGIEFVWVAAFDKVLSDAEVLALHNSLGASNAFALVSSATTHNVTLANSSQANAASTVAITSSATTGTLTTAPLKNNAGTLLANETGATAYIHHMTTGALIVAKTGQTTNASGVMTVTDAAIAAGTQYRIVVKLASNAEGLDKLTAT